MRKDTIQIEGLFLTIYSLNTLIIGSGAAALNAAIQLRKQGQDSIAIVTEQWAGGTSKNAGSDKQTYYKVSIAGDQPDSAIDMARDLFAGGSMHGDIALCEAVNSLPAFFHLVHLGVPLPHDSYGAYAGFRTDYDSKQRGTSAGPLTSRLMFDALAKKIDELKIPVLDQHQVIAFLSKKEGEYRHVMGAVALDKKNLSSESLGFVVFNTVNVILASGGPAEMYKYSAYPESQSGSCGFAYEIGAIGSNLTESQFGLASTKFRWNLSGTYQQVIPRYISTDQHGGDEREFLSHLFPDMSTLANAIFLKGYQWPFDVRKIRSYGSSLIDLLVYRETVRKGRRVFLDFTRNPGQEGRLKGFSLEKLAEEAYQYLKNSGALEPTPIDRLRRMNPQAVEVFREHDIDLSRDYLEIAVCAQHNNGGLRGNIWWESNVKHLFPIGEANGSHGVYRPGGAALNSGQVGGIRSALYISQRYNGIPPNNNDFFKVVRDQIGRRIKFAKRIIDRRQTSAVVTRESRREIQERMSQVAGHIRNPKKIKKAVIDAYGLHYRLENELRIPSVAELPAAFRNLDLCLTHVIYLEAIEEYLSKKGRSRGGCLVMDAGGRLPCPGLEEEWKLSLNPVGSFVDDKIQEIFLDDQGNIHKQWVDVRPIPQENPWFEEVWHQYRTGNLTKQQS